MKWLSLRLLGAGSILAFTTFAAAVAADSLAYSFKAKGNIEVGQVVALTTNDKNTVELAPANNPSRIYGVAVNLSDAPLAVQNSSQKTIVATSGIYPVLASTENGPIKTGDYLSMSSQDGIAAKVKGRQTFVVGRATEKFDGSSGAVGKSPGGSPIGRVSAAITPGKNPSLLEDAGVPAPLRRIGESIAGKPLTASRLYSALIIFLVTAAIALSLLWVGVRSGLIAIGRNPLSRHSILQSLAQVVVASCVVFAGGLFGVYLFLRI